MEARMTLTKERSQVEDVDKKDTRSVSLPVFMLTLLGTVITVLGLFAAGEIGLVIVGLAAVALAGLLHVFGNRQ
jgi:hypothetical protein